jgi:hypothetical protein
MNYAEASALAKANPGSMLKGNSDDGYVVIYSNRGAIAPTPTSSSPSLLVSPVHAIEGEKSTDSDAKSAETSTLQASLAELYNLNAELQQILAMERKEHQVAILRLEVKHQTDLKTVQHESAEQLRRILKTYKLAAEKVKVKFDSLLVDLSVAKGTIDRLESEKKLLSLSATKASPPRSEAKLIDTTVRGDSLLAERRSIKCSCRGVVENCFKCSGSGHYTVNGYGNPV